MTSDVHEMRGELFDDDPRAAGYDEDDEFDDEDEPEDYRSLSGLAVAALIVGVVSPLALVAPILLLIPLLGTVLGLLAIRKVRRESEYFTGLGLAIFGLAISVLMVTAAGAMHSLFGALAVPEGYEQINFRDLQPDPKRREMPIPPSALELDGRKIFVKGYIYPGMRRTGLVKFVLVPDMKTCCFGGQPKSSDMIEVTLSGGQSTKAGMTKKKLAGTFTLNNSPKRMTDFDNNVYYRMKVDQVR
jgi:hypothetical protein